MCKAAVLDAGVMEATQGCNSTHKFIAYYSKAVLRRMIKRNGILAERVSVPDNDAVYTESRTKIQELLWIGTAVA